jgi:regulator of replication initiation timing
MSNVHILPDENLGGVLREYVEVDRKVEVGDYVVFKSDGNRIAKVVTEKDNVINIAKETFEITAVLFGTTLEPTDIVVIDNQRDGKPSRFRLVDRKAKAGEKVLTVKYNEDDTGIKPGDVLTCNKSDYDDGSISVLNGRGFFDISIGDKYYVLEPLDSAEPEPIEVDTRHASPQVIDMIANLAQRVTELERELSDVKKVTNTEMGARSVHTERWLEVKDEIDTLHANQRKLAEETTNRLDRHSERIRELAEMIGEQKAFKIDIDNRYVLEVKRK